jgi:uncharacterized membrane protein
VAHKKNENNTKETSRIETFSDGVFAIAITLLVLELIQTLHTPTGDGLLKSTLKHWEPFVAFTVGFVTILVCWYNHHVMFEYIKKVDTKLVWINGFLLFVVTLTPFPTAVLAQYLQKDSTTALLLFGFTYFFMSFAYDRLSTYAFNNHLVEEENREYFNSFKLIYRYAMFYTFVILFVCFISIAVPIILYVILFALFAAPKEFASRLNKIRMTRNKTK